MTTTELIKLQNEKEDLIELITWYRDSYFQPCMRGLCDVLIEDCQKAENMNDFDIIHQMVDDWIDL